MNSTKFSLSKHPVETIVEGDNEIYEEISPLAPLISSNYKITEAMLRISRSTGPKEILLKLAINRHLLELQLSAVKLQSIIRKFIAKRQVNRIRTYFAIFNRVTKEIADRYMEEMVLAICFEESLGYFRTYHRYEKAQSAIQFEIEAQTEELIDEVNAEMCYELIKDMLLNAVDIFLSHCILGP